MSMCRLWGLSLARAIPGVRFLLQPAICCCRYVPVCLTRSTRRGWRIWSHDTIYPGRSALNSWAFRHLNSISRAISMALWITTQVRPKQLKIFVVSSSRVSRLLKMALEPSWLIILKFLNTIAAISIAICICRNPLRLFMTARH